MKQISIQDLKAQLSALISEAEAGHTIVITRHKEPVAQLMPVQPGYLHGGRKVAAGKIDRFVTRDSSQEDAAKELGLPV